MITYDMTGDQAIEQGASFYKKIVWKDSLDAPINLTGYSARMQIRPSLKASKVIVELGTSPGSGIALGGALGTIELSLTAAQTAAITESQGVYDLELISGSGFVTRMMGGAVEFSPEVTR